MEESRRKSSCKLCVITSIARATAFICIISYYLLARKNRFTPGMKCQSWSSQLYQAIIRTAVGAGRFICCFSRPCFTLSVSPREGSRPVGDSACMAWLTPSASCQGRQDHTSDYTTHCLLLLYGGGAYYSQPTKGTQTKCQVSPDVDAPYLDVWS